MVRDTVGMNQSMKSNKNRMVLCVFRSEELHRLLERYGKKSYFNALHPRHKGYWQFLGRVDLGHTWFFHAPVALDSEKDTFDLKRCLFEAVGQEFEFDSEYLGFWDLRIAIADNYRVGRVFIAGDSAHSHPPYGGLGVNNGFEDARNLSWKLAAYIQGWGSDRLLDSYSLERQPVFNSTADDFIARMIEDDAKFLSKYNPELNNESFKAEWLRRSKDTKKDVDNFVPHYSGSPVIVGGEGSTSAWGIHAHEAMAGYHLSPQDSVIEQLDSGLNLILIGKTHSVAEQFIEAAKKLSIPLKVIEVDKTKNTAKWQANTILVRPDTFVAFACTGFSGSAERILETSTGRD